MIKSIPTPTTPNPITPLRAPAARGRRRTRNLLMLGSGFAMLGLAAAASAIASRAFDHSLTRLDEQALRQAGVALERTVERHKAHVLSEIRLLADDNRVRATVITPRFDEATVRDVLDDLRRASGAALMAVLDVNGTVGAVSGMEALKKDGLGQTAAVKGAMEKPTSDVWSFPDKVLVVAIAPVLSGNQVAALLMVGVELGPAALAAIEQTLGVSSGLVVADRVVARSSNDAAVAAALEAARGGAEGPSRAVSSSKAFLARVTRTSDSGAAARAVWLVPHHHQAGLFGPVPQALWMPVLAVVAMLLLSIVWTRR
jgi:hypothetical protein